MKVDVGTTLNQDVTLEVGGVAEHVEVTVHSRLVETASGAAGTTVEITQVLEMPLVDRNVFNLMNLVPGSFNLGGTVSLGGGRSAWPMVDGINDTRGGLAAAGIEMSPPVDSMQDFKVVVSSYGAEYGRSEGGMLNAVTKSGTNRFNGSLYEFLRNNLFDARGWGADVKPPLQRNNYGGTIGGPIRRNRTFFFFNFDGLRQHQGEARTANVGVSDRRTFGNAAVREVARSARFEGDRKLRFAAGSAAGQHRDGRPLAPKPSKLRCRKAVTDAAREVIGATAAPNIERYARLITWETIRESLGWM